MMEAGLLQGFKISGLVFLVICIFYFSRFVVNLLFITQNFKHEKLKKKSNLNLSFDLELNNKYNKIVKKFKN